MTDANGTRNTMDNTANSQNGPAADRPASEQRTDAPNRFSTTRPPSRYLPPNAAFAAGQAADQADSQANSQTSRQTASRTDRHPPGQKRGESSDATAASTASLRGRKPAAKTAKTGTRRSRRDRRTGQAPTPSTRSKVTRLHPNARKKAAPIKIASTGKAAGKTESGAVPQSRTTAPNAADGKLAGSAPKRSLSKSAGDPAAVRKLSRRRNRRSFKPPVPLLYLSRLLVAGLGIAAIGGTILAIRPSNSPSAARTESALATDAEESPANFPMPLNQEISPLKAAIEELPNTYPNLRPKTFYIDVDTGNYVDVDGQDSIAAASTIKLPILLAFFEEIDAGRIDLNQTMAIAPEQIAEGSGEMQLSPPGTQFTALEVATQMIVGSDNTATNMMIDLMGGGAALNTRFEAYGLQHTRLVSPLPDLEGTNTISARDLVHTLILISQGDALTMRSRDRVLNILNRTRNKSLIPAGLEEKGALTYNKTGDIGSVLADAALVDLSNGKRYAIAALVQRPNNDGRAADLIQSISGRTYQEAEKAIQPAVSPLGDPNGASATPTPENTPDSSQSAQPSEVEAQ
ncbi:MAG: serine hydrolase [Cyanobacteria bacterium J06649_5]